MKLDASNDSLDGGTASTVDNMEPLCTSQWVYVIGDGSGAAGTGAIVSKFTGTNTGWLLRYLNTTTPYRKCFSGFQRFSGTDQEDCTPDNGVSLSTWYHLAYCYDNSATTNRGAMWINGVSQTMTQRTGPPTGTRDSDAATNFCIGSIAGATTVFNGYIDEVYIWTGTALTQTMVDQLYSSKRRRKGLEVNVANLKHYWPLYECAEGATASTAGMFKDYVQTDHLSPSGSPIGAQGILSNPSFIKLSMGDFQRWTMEYMWRRCGYRRVEWWDGGVKVFYEGVDS